MPATPFVDVVDHWSMPYVEDLRVRGAVSGKTESSFGPDDYLTRGELAKIAVNSFGLETGGSTSFSDVDAGAWYMPYVAGVEAAGVVTGYEDGTFRPNEKVNRAEALKILLEASGMDLETAASAGFSDVVAGAWYENYVDYSYAAGVATGYEDGTFGVAKNVRRGEMAKMASELLGMI